jgi:hypothetical protein
LSPLAGAVVACRAAAVQEEAEDGRVRETTDGTAAETAGFGL